MSWREHYSRMWDKNNEENEKFRERMKKNISQRKKSFYMKG